MEADGRETGAEGPLAFSVGLRTRRRPPAGPSVLPSAGFTVGKSREGRRGRADVQVGSSRVGWVLYWIRILEVGEIERWKEGLGNCPRDQI